MAANMKKEEDEDLKQKTLLRYKMQRACIDGNIEILKELISNGIGVNDTTDSMYGNKMTPLHFAAQFGRKDIVEYLLSFGANPDVQNQFRWKPLDLAVSQKNIDITVQLLPCTTPYDDWKSLGTPDFVANALRWSGARFRRIKYYDRLKAYYETNKFIYTMDHILSLDRESSLKCK